MLPQQAYAPARNTTTDASPSSRYPWSQPDVQASLYHEPKALRAPLRTRLAELESILEQQTWYEFRPVTDQRCLEGSRWNLHLHPTDVTPQAHTSSASEGKEEPMHVTSILTHPSLGPEAFYIVAEHVLVAMDHPGSSTDTGAGG